MSITSHTFLPMSLYLLFSAWNDVGNLGYIEYNGNCHTGSSYTGYFSSSCCSNRETKLAYTWCLKKNIGKRFANLLVVYSNYT